MRLTSCLKKPSEGKIKAFSNKDAVVRSNKQRFIENKTEEKINNETSICK